MFEHTPAGVMIEKNSIKDVVFKMSFHEMRKYLLAMYLWNNTSNLTLDEALSEAERQLKATERCVDNGITAKVILEKTEYFLNEKRENYEKMCNPQPIQVDVFENTTKEPLKKIVASKPIHDLDCDILGLPIQEHTECPITGNVKTIQKVEGGVIKRFILSERTIDEQNKKRELAWKIVLFLKGKESPCNFKLDWKELWEKFPCDDYQFFFSSVCLLEWWGITTTVWTTEKMDDGVYKHYEIVLAEKLGAIHPSKIPDNWKFDWE